MKLLAFIPLLLLSLPPPTSSQRGPLSYGRSYGRYGHRSSYGTYGLRRIPSNTGRAKYPSWEPWANQYKKSDETDEVADPEPEPRYKSRFGKAAKIASILKKSGKIRYIKTTPRPTTTKRTTTTTTTTTTTASTTRKTTTTTESFDDVFELGSNGLDRSNIRAQRLSIEDLPSNKVTPSSVDSSTKGWPLILDGFNAVPAVPMEYVRPSFMPVPAVPDYHDDI